VAGLRGCKNKYYAAYMLRVHMLGGPRRSCPGWRRQARSEALRQEAMLLLLAAARACAGAAACLRTAAPLSTIVSGKGGT
jgi:3'-phosphoadenosine 5'-phosphosulfate sulfotransferase